MKSGINRFTSQQTKTRQVLVLFLEFHYAKCGFKETSCGLNTVETRVDALSFSAGLFRPSKVSAAKPRERQSKRHIVRRILSRHYAGEYGFSLPHGEFRCTSSTRGK